MNTTNQGGIKRYEAHDSCELVSDGPYVNFADHETEIARLRAEADALRVDALRYQWLCEDHADADTRRRRNDLLEYFRVRSYSANSTAIDAAMNLAASQPARQQPAYNAAGISLTACQLHEALLMAGDPELDVPFEDRSLVRIFSMESGHSGPGLYCECVDAEEEGCILLDGTAPAIGQTTRSLDLVPRAMDTAPRDGTMVRLLVKFEENATEDTAEPAWTIGACNNDNVGEDERIGWQFAGWCWTHDHFTEGKGTPVGWLPLIDSLPVRNG